MKARLLLIFLLSPFILCAQNIFTNDVEICLKLAGNNRRSLEKLLQSYYKTDKERYAAALYLIKGMAHHAQAGKIISYDSRVDSIITHSDNSYYTLIKNTTADAQESNPLHAAIKNAAKESANQIAQWQLKEPYVEECELLDIKTLDGTFLKRQIDYAFALREKNLRLRQLSLNDFFDYVLSFRPITDYPLVVDNETIGRIYSKYIMADTTQNIKSLSERYNRATWWLRHFGGTYPFESTMGWKEMFFTGDFHDCIDKANYAAIIYRACGWPAAVEFNMAYKLWAGQHYDLVIPSVDKMNNWQKNNEWLSFSPETEVAQPNEHRFNSCLNIYRYHYNQVNNAATLCAKGEPIPTELNDAYIEDVTRNYTQVTRLELPYDTIIPHSRKLAYLASFTSQGGLTAVTWGIIDHKSRKITFDNVVVNNIYFPVFMTDTGQIQPFGIPFKLTDTSQPLICSNDKCFIPLFNNEKQRLVNNVKLTHKFPRKPSMLVLAKRVVGTCIIASNQSDFAQSDTLATINKTPDDAWHTLLFHPQQAYRYYRICAPSSDPHLLLSEVQFLTRASHCYTNTIPIDIDSLKAYVRIYDEPLEKCKWKAEYDGNVQTAPDVWPNVTLNLQNPQWVEGLRFMVKNEDNHIRKNHQYVLRMWTAAGWRICNVFQPFSDEIEGVKLKTNQLYWLSDKDAGSEELPFMLNKQGNIEFPHAWLLKE